MEELEERSWFTIDERLNIHQIRMKLCLEELNGELTDDDRQTFENKADYRSIISKNRVFAYFDIFECFRNKIWINIKNYRIGELTCFANTNDTD